MKHNSVSNTEYQHSQTKEKKDDYEMLYQVCSADRC